MRALVVFCILLMGCSTTSGLKTPQELRINHAIIPLENDKTKVAIDGPDSKGSGALTGAAKGAGVGVGTVAVLSTACGPWYWICLASGSIFYGGPIGGLFGAAYGSATSEDSVIVKEKHAMLTKALNALDASQTLAPLVYKKSLEPLPHQPSQEDSPSTTENPAWTLRIVLDEFATVGSGPAKPYSLQLSASVEMMRLGDKEPAFIKGYQANSPSQMSTTEWRANDDEPVRLALDDLLANLATEIFNDLMPMQLSLEKPVEDYIVHVQPLSTETKSEPVAVLETSQSPSPVVQGAYNPDQINLFDPITGMTWIVVDSSPVDLDTANNMCKSLVMGDDKKYRLPSLHEFEELWKKYKNDKRISIFKKREYCTDGKEVLSRPRRAYSQTYSFLGGNSGQQYTAYLTCVAK